MAAEPDAAAFRPRTEPDQRLDAEVLAMRFQAFDDSVVRVS